MTDDLWPYALRLYSAPGISDACLTLQSSLGADVNLVLFAAWMGARGHTLSPDETDAARQLVTAWHAEIVKPLRAVRMRMKQGPAPAPSPRTEELRTRLKAVEIDSEKVELETLAAFGRGLQAGSGAPEPVEANIRAVLALDTDAGPDVTDAITAITTAARGM